MKNLVILIGRIGTAPTTRTMRDSSVTDFSLVTTLPKFEDGQVAKDERGYTKTHDEWHKVTVFGKLGEIVAKHKGKGDLVEIQGRLHYSKYTDANNIERYSVEIIADEVLFL